MTSLLREGVYEKRPQEILEGEVEFDELYVVAGHKGRPDLTLRHQYCAFQSITINYSLSKKIAPFFLKKLIQSTL